MGLLINAIHIKSMEFYIFINMQDDLSKTSDVEVRRALGVVAYLGGEHVVRESNKEADRTLVALRGVQGREVRARKLCQVEQREQVLT